MQVGVNYPWFDYGWDFGEAPPGWRGQAAPRWLGRIDEHLQHFHALGISVVRWFILGDGLTYGTGARAPRREVASGQWRFEPLPLGQSTVEHFEELLRRFGQFNAGAARPIQLLPVLIDFHFCEPGHHPVLRADPSDAMHQVADSDWVKQGRVDAIVDPNKRGPFLTEVLDPLLRVSQRHRDVIYAWELINEPDWVTNGWHPDGRSDHPVGESSMRAFIEDGKNRIRHAGFKPTIGFALVDTLCRSQITADINQFHHYPDGRHRLGVHHFDPRFPGIIGEFATALTDIWPDLHPARQSVLDRLRLADQQQYPLALLWSFLQKDEHTAWSVDAERQIQLFTAGQ